MQDAQQRAPVGVTWNAVTVASRHAATPTVILSAPPSTRRAVHRAPRGVRCPPDGRPPSFRMRQLNATRGCRSARPRSARSPSITAPASPPSASPCPSNRRFASACPSRRLVGAASAISRRREHVAVLVDPRRSVPVVPPHDREERLVDLELARATVLRSMTLSTRCRRRGRRSPSRRSSRRRAYGAHHPNDEVCVEVAELVRR